MALAVRSCVHQLSPRNELTNLPLRPQIVYAQQALHRNCRAAVFDPRPFCSLLFDNLQSISPSEQSGDLQLIGHALARTRKFRLALW